MADEERRAGYYELAREVGKLGGQVQSLERLVKDFIRASNQYREGSVRWQQQLEQNVASQVQEVRDDVTAGRLDVAPIVEFHARRDARRIIWRARRRITIHWVVGVVGIGLAGVVTAYAERTASIVAAWLTRNNGF